MAGMDPEHAKGLQPLHRPLSGPLAGPGRLGQCLVPWQADAGGGVGEAEQQGAEDPDGGVGSRAAVLTLLAQVVAKATPRNCRSIRADFGAATGLRKLLPMARLFLGVA